MDADVCIDLLRKYPPALTWFQQLTAAVGIPGFAALELVVGSQNAIELRAVRALVSSVPIVWPAEADMQRALDELAPLRLSHGLGGFDAVIAATALGRGDTLLTFNVAHFAAVPGLTVEQPDART